MRIEGGPSRTTLLPAGSMERRALTQTSPMQNKKPTLFLWPLPRLTCQETLARIGGL